MSVVFVYTMEVWRGQGFGVGGVGGSGEEEYILSPLRRPMPSVVVVIEQLRWTSLYSP